MVSRAERTGRVFVVHRAACFRGFGGEISATIAENAIEHMGAPIARVTGLDTLFPNRLEHRYMPDDRRSFEAIERVYDY